MVEQLDQPIYRSNFELVNYTDAKGERRQIYLPDVEGTLMLIVGYCTAVRRQ